MFSYLSPLGDMLESRQDHVELKGVSANAVSTLLEFAYTGKLKLEPDDITDILGGATHLQMLDVVALCTEHLLKELSSNTCVDTLNIAEAFSLQDVKTAAVKYISENFKTMACTDQLLKLSVDHLCMFVKSNDLCVESELSLFENVVAWIDSDPSEREKDIGRVMQYIRFALMKPEELVDHVSRSPFMATGRKAHVYLDEALHFHILPARQPLMQTPRTQIRASPSMVALRISYREMTVLKSGNWRRLLSEQIPEYVLDSRCGGISAATLATVDNYLYVCGGNSYASSDCSKSCSRYDPRCNSWFSLKSMTVGRCYFPLVGITGKLFAVGGAITQDRKATDQAEMYSVETGTWNAISPLQGARKNAAACELDGKIYISGGSTDTETRSTMWRYSIDDNTWEERAPLLTPLARHVMMAAKGDIYTINRTNMAISCYSPTSNQWSAVASGLDKISYVKQLVVSGTWVYLIGYVKSGESTRLAARYNMMCREIESIPPCYAHYWDQALHVLLATRNEV